MHKSFYFNMRVSILFIFIFWNTMRERIFQWIQRQDIVYIAVTVFCMYVILLVIFKLSWPRSFSKFTSLDTASTLAIWSIVWSVVLNPDTGIVFWMLCVWAILFFQIVIWRIRKYNKLSAYFHNKPIILVQEWVILENNLEKWRVTKADLYEHMRRNNIAHLHTIKLWVLEITWELSFIHNTKTIDKELLPHD